MVRVVAPFYLKPGMLDQFMETAAPLITETRKEAGCITYELAQSANDPQVLVMLEAWETQGALDTHVKSAHFTAIVPKLKALCTDNGAETALYTKLL
ncbi:MAG: antibiotic biosynthesis monooxygenase [Oscillospiraceae bacterium]|nr:antibiotic biosynthesis monooxygenase [Oscillospiraceae bacterium]